MKTLRLILSISVFALLLQSCSIHSGQLSSLASLVDASQTSYAKNRWTVSYGSYQAEVFPVLNKGEISFLNEFGDSLIFDGWVVREVSGLGVNRADWKVLHMSNSRRFLNKDRLVAEHLCSSWYTDKSSNMTKYSQECKSFASYKNSILVDSQGFITLIRQTVDGSSTYIKLSKN